MKIHKLFFLISLTCSNLLYSFYKFDAIKTHNLGGCLKKEFLKQIVYDFKPTIFIETGTYAGETTEQAIDLFNEIHTIELQESMYNEAKKKFSTFKNVHVYNGESGDILKMILPNLRDNKILFFLDAHYCGIGTGWGRNITSIIDELNAIKRAEIKDCLILIDDVRGFGTDILNKEFICAEGYPSIQKIYSMLQEINANFDYILLGDTLFAYPKQEIMMSSEVSKACTLSRLECASNEEDLIEAELKIGKISKEERKFLISVFNDLNQYNTKEYHIYLWYGLMQLQNNQTKEAIDQFNRILNNGFDHWRIYWYLALAYQQIDLHNEARNAIKILLTKKPNFVPAANLLKIWKMDEN